MTDFGTENRLLATYSVLLASTEILLNSRRTRDGLNANGIKNGTAATTAASCGIIAVYTRGCLGQLGRVCFDRNGCLLLRPLDQSDSCVLLNWKPGIAIKIRRYTLR